MSTSTDYNLDTKQGLANAITWLNKLLGQVKEGGVWAIPRAESAYQVSHEGKTLTLTFGAGDGPTERVAVAAGWSVLAPGDLH